MEQRDRKEYFRQYRAKNREKLNANLNRWQKENKEKVAGYCKKYLADPEHREKVNKRRREWYQENIDRVREMNRNNQAICRARKQTNKEKDNEK